MSHSKNSSISDHLNYFNFKHQPSSPSLRSVQTSPALPTQQTNDNVSSLSLDQQQHELSKIILPSSDPRSPYHISLPYQTTQPTEELSKRFTIWKKIIKQLIFYFKELAMLRQHYYQLNVHMLQNIQFLSLNNKNKPKKALSPNEMPLQAHDIFFGTSEDKFINASFLPTNSKSVQGIPTTLFNYHKSLSDKELQTYNDLTLKIIPRLENLKKSLNFKIKEIINLKSDFKFTQLRSEVAKTGQILNQYISSVEMLEKGFVTLNTKGIGESEWKASGKQDPYLLRIQLDLQLKKQLLEENYLKEAFNNLQQSGLELERIIYKELQTAITNFTNLICSEVDSVKRNLIDDLQQNFLHNDSAIDWNYYMNNDNGKNFLNTEEKRQFRKLTDINYPYQRKVLSAALKSGTLLKKNKVTKTYTKFYYVLTMNYLHEFKTSDRQKENIPLQSLNLNSCTILEHNDRKLILQYITKEKNKVSYVFKCNDAKEAAKWVSEIKELVSFTNSIERNKFFELKYASSQPASINSSSSSSSYRVASQQQQQQPSALAQTPLQPSQLKTVSSASSLNARHLTPTHGKSSSMSSLSRGDSSTSLQSKHNSSSSSLSKVLASASSPLEDPGKFTTHLNLSSNNLVPSISVTDHSPSSRHSSGSSVMVGSTANKNVDYFNIKPATTSSSQTSLTMKIDKKLPYTSGTRTPPSSQQAQQQSSQSQSQSQAPLQKHQFKLNLPSQNLNQMMIDDMKNMIKTPGELPQTSIGDIINGYQVHHISDDSPK